MGTRERRWRVKRRVNPRVWFRIRFGTAIVFMFVLFSLLVAQLWKLQIVHGASYRERAELNRLRVVTVPSPRGGIVDRTGQPLVRNVPSFTAAIVPADLPEEREDEVISKLAHLLLMSEQEVREPLEKARRAGFLYEPARIRRGIPHDLALILEERSAELPGVVVLTEAKREYTTGPLTAAIVGYLGRITAEEYAALADKGYSPNDRLGKAGVEGAWEERLRGQPGREQIEVNVYGRPMKVLAHQEPRAGDTVVLSLDLGLQRTMTQVLRETMGRSRYAAAVAVNPRTGEVLGLVSLPTFDNNVFEDETRVDEIVALLSDQRNPLLNYAISATAPPGSTFKVITGAAALQERVATPSTVIVSTGAITVPSAYVPGVSWTFPDWMAHGPLDFRRAIARSSDVYFYYLAGGYFGFRGLGVERLAAYSRAFGFGSRLGIDLPGEVEGIIPDPAWKEATLGEPWAIGDTYNMGIGQGFVTVTPLQLAMAVAAVANGGELLQPQVVREVIGPNGEVVVPFEKKVIRHVPVDDRHLQVVREGMRMVVDPGGTAYPQAYIPGLCVAGKTGTAEYAGPRDAQGNLPTHGWFVAFAPCQDPQIVVVVFHERGQGAMTAAPAAGRILRAYFGREASPTVARAP